jgi:hypothetical protein
MSVHLRCAVVCKHGWMVIVYLDQAKWIDFSRAPWPG